MAESPISLLKRYAGTVKLADYNFFFPDNIPLLLPVEEDLAAALPTFRNLDKPTWTAIRETVDLYVAARFLTFGIRMAIMAVRTGRSGYIDAGVMGLTLDNDELDCRDVATALCLLADAAVRIGADRDAISQGAQACAVAARAQDIASFATGAPGERAVQSMGFKAFEGPDGFVYRSTFIPPPAEEMARMFNDQND